jgi:hypothetical protein
MKFLSKIFDKINEIKNGLPDEIDTNISKSDLKTLTIDELENISIDDFILYSNRVLSNNRNLNAQQLSDICKLSCEIAFFKNNIPIEKRSEIENIYRTCYRSLFNKKLESNPAIAKLKLYFDNYILSIDKFGISSVGWAIKEELITGEKIFPFSVKEKFESVFHYYYEPIINTLDNKDQVKQHFLDAILNEYGSISVNLFSVYFYLTLKSNRTLSTVIGDSSKKLRSFLINYKDSYSIISNPKIGGDVLIKNLLLSVSMLDEIGNIGTGITWFQNNAVEFTKDETIFIFLNSFKSVETIKESSVESFHKLNQNDKQLFSLLFTNVVGWVAYLLSKQYSKQHFSEIDSIDIVKKFNFKKEFEKLDVIYNKWASSEIDGLSLGGEIVYGFAKEFSLHSDLFCSKEKGLQEHVLMADCINELIIGTVDHFFYICHGIKNIKTI